MKNFKIILALIALCCGLVPRLYSQVGTCYSLPTNGCELVWNGDLETYTGVPVSGLYSSPQVTLACPWTTPNAATPDYYTADCPAGNSFDVPVNGVGVEPANSGNGYAGYASYYSPYPGLREFIAAPLRCVLIAGVTYNLTYYVSLADSSRWNGQVAAAISPSMPAWPSLSGGPLPGGSTLSTGTVVSNKVGWVAINTSFVAVGGEQFIIIGNFNSAGPGPVNYPSSTYTGAYVYVDDVSLVPVQNLSVNAVPNPVTCGNSTMLTNTYGASIDYSGPGWSATGVTAVTPGNYTTTTYTGVITYCTGCTQSATTTVTTTPLTITVHPPPAVCPGSCVTMTASGATLYQWQPGGLSGSSVTVCPSGPTTYTVTGTTGTCSATTTVLVTMAPTPTITATASPSTLTPPAATTTIISTSVSGGSGFTYSWVPAATLSSATSSSPVATPTVTTIYTVTVTNSNGCTGTTTVQVTVTPQNLCTLPYSYVINGGTASAAFPSMSGLSGQNIKISGVFTVDVPFNFSSCNIVMEPNAQINVASGVTLLVTGQTHIYACDSMWNGINLLSGSNAQLLNASIIEDAVAGVTVNTGSTATIDNVIFNRNHTAVKILANTGGSSPVTMKGCVVTCRDLNLYPNVTSNPSPGTVWSNITSYTYTGMNMKWPFYAYRSIYGVTATDVNNLQIGNSTSSLVFNGFDTLMAAGIHLTRTNAVVYNNKFRHITSQYNPYTPLIGTGVFGLGSASSAYTVIVGGNLPNQPNEFYNVNTSVDVTLYTTNLVLYNTIQNTSSTTATWGGYGRFGVRITPAANNTVTVTNNTITNAATGIIVNRNNTTTPQTVSLTINNNLVAANIFGFCNTGISLTDPSSAVTLNGTVHEINYNTIAEAGTCINLLNVKNKMVVYYNSCLTRYHATANINGIKLSNCATVDVLNNHTKSTVTGTNINSYGIYLLNSASNAVRCNTMEHATRSLVFSGNCLSPSGYTQNTMKTAQDGIVILSAATIGIQGSTATGSDNYWELSTVTCEIWNGSGSQTFYASTFAPSGLSTAPTICGAVTMLPGGIPTGCGSVPARLAGPEEPTTTSSLLVYPNPNNGTFNITCSSDAPKDVYVYDMNGRLVYSNIQTTETNLAIDISSEAKGLYVVQVIMGDEIQSARISNQ